jgi:hypothetical protein
MNGLFTEEERAHLDDAVQGMAEVARDDGEMLRAGLLKGLLEMLLQPAPRLSNAYQEEVLVDVIEQLEEIKEADATSCAAKLRGLTGLPYLPRGAK